MPQKKNSTPMNAPATKMGTIALVRVRALVFTALTLAPVVSLVESSAALKKNRR